MPQIKKRTPPLSVEDVFLATNPIRWQFVLEARKGTFEAKKCREIARRSPTFKGGDTAARAHAAQLVKAKILDRRTTGGSVCYALGLKGEALEAHIRQLGRSRVVRAETGSRLIALVARVEQSDYEAFELGDRTDAELVLDLRTRARSARRRVRIAKL